MTVYPLSLSVGYYYSLSIVVGAVTNLLLAGMLLLGSRHVEYSDLKVYRRSRLLTAISLAIFGIGFLLHWWFCPRLEHPMAAVALSLAYFHAGGMLLAMSHTSLADPHYLNGRAITRDLCLLGASLACYALGVVTDEWMALYAGFAITLSHVIFLAIMFYRRFRHAYLLLGNLAENSHTDNLSDQGIRWMYVSCQLIIACGILGILITVIFNGSMIAPVVMMVVGEVVFCYICFALSDFGLIARQTNTDMLAAEDFVSTETGQNSFRNYVQNFFHKHPLARYSFFTGFYRLW